MHRTVAGGEQVYVCSVPVLVDIYDLSRCVCVPESHSAFLLPPLFVNGSRPTRSS